VWKPARPSTLHTLKKQMTAEIMLPGDSLIASRNGLLFCVTEIQTTIYWQVLLQR
jgi:hypothetical protein